MVSEIWLDWLKDEIKMASENSEREKVYELFERAVKDYICKFLIRAIKCIVQIMAFFFWENIFRSNAEIASKMLVWSDPYFVLKC